MNREFLQEIIIFHFLWLKVIPFTFHMNLTFPVDLVNSLSYPVMPVYLFFSLHSQTRGLSRQPSHTFYIYYSSCDLPVLALDWWFALGQTECVSVSRWMPPFRSHLHLPSPATLFVKWTRKVKLFRFVRFVFLRLYSDTVSFTSMFDILAAIGSRTLLSLSRSVAQ